MSFDDPLAAAAIAVDVARFDALVDERPVWERLHAAIARDVALHQALPRYGGEFDVGEAMPLGQPGLWLATSWVFEAAPRERKPLFPLHERWDTLLAHHEDKPEAAWLSAELAGALRADQAALRRRIELGHRRFGSRGQRLWSRRVG